MFAMSNKKTAIITAIIAIVIIFILISGSIANFAGNISTQTHALALGMDIGGNDQTIAYWMQGEKERISSFVYTVSEEATAIDYGNISEFIKGMYPFFDRNTSDPYVVFINYKTGEKQAEKLARQVLKPINRPMSNNDNVMVAIIRPAQPDKDLYVYTFYVKYSIPIIHTNVIIKEQWEPENE